MPSDVLASPMKHAGLVAVERECLVVRLQICASRLEVAELRLGCDEMQPHQPADGALAVSIMGSMSFRFADGLPIF